MFYNACMYAYIFREKGILEKKELNEPVLSDEKGALLSPLFLTPCSSDVHTVYAGNGPRREDLVLGHEGLAKVVKVGAGVKDFKPGEIVAVCAVMPEYERPVDHTEALFSDSRKEPTGHENSPFSGCKLGRNIDGMWQEVFYVPSADENLAHIPQGLSYEDALMAVDVMATGFTAADEANIQKGQVAVVLGTGAVGLMAVAAAHEKGAHVIAVGSEKRELNTELAMAFGADAVISYKDGHILKGNLPCIGCGKCVPERSPLANSLSQGVVDTVLNCTLGKGVDSCIITGGMPDSLKTSCDIIKYGTGTAVNVAYIEGNGEIALPIFSLGRGMAGKTFKFALSKGGRKWTEEMLQKASHINPGKLITKKLSGFDSIPTALSMMKERDSETIKIMIEV